jgi:AcrR family transcriptional regulator
MKRRYELRRRAESQAGTRRKIVEATVHLHEKLGPRATTISAIAEQAGVQRLTVYRHFPDDTALFAACSSHWLAQHPLPDPAIWRSIAEWRPRCRAGLAAVYTYYRRNDGMLASVFRDADLPAMQAPMQGFAGFYRQTREDLLEAAPPALARSKPFAETIRHALAFATWQGLADRFTDGEMVNLVMAWLEGIATSEEGVTGP